MRQPAQESHLHGVKKRNVIFFLWAASKLKLKESKIEVKTFALRLTYLLYVDWSSFSSYLFIHS